MPFFSAVQNLANGLMDELNSAKTALKLQVGGLPRRGATSHKRDAGAVQTSLSALPTLNWSQLTQYASSLSGVGSGDGFDSFGSVGNRYAAAAAPYSSSGGLDLLSGNATPSAPPPPGQRQPQQPNLLPFDPRALGGGAGSLPAASHEVQQRHALLPSAQQVVMSCCPSFASFFLQVASACATSGVCVISATTARLGWRIWSWGTSSL